MLHGKLLIGPSGTNFSENVFEKCRLEIAAILSRPQCVNLRKGNLARHARCNGETWGPFH